MNDPVATLLAKHEIHEVLLRFCRGIDRLDKLLVQSCYHEDAEDDHGMWKGSGPNLGSDLVDFAASGSAKLTQHCLQNVLIEIDGDVAVSEAYCVAYHRRPSPGSGEVDHVVGLRYVDRFARRHGSWRIARRSLVFEWTRVDPVREEGSPWQLGPGFLTGTRDEADPLYRELAAIRSGAGG